MRILLLIFVIQSLYLNVLGYDCKTISKNTEYKSSNFIFLGEVIQVNEIVFKVKVLETLKGNEPDTIVYGKTDNCTNYPKQGEIWLFYSKNYDGNEIYINRCGWSRSFNWPFNVNSEVFPKPPPPNIDDATLELLNKINFETALSEFMYDIISLRQMRMQHDLEKIKQNAIKGKELYFLVNKEFVRHRWILMSCTLLIVIFGAILYFKMK